MKHDQEVSSNDSMAQSGQNRGRKGAIASAHEAQQMIAVAAYYRAQARGFAPGCELDDWLAAEAEVSAEQDDNAPA